MMSLGKRLAVEGMGTAWLVFVGCGSIVLTIAAPQPDYGALQVALAFGLALATATYALERLSGAHFNPVVTVGFAVANRFPIRDLVPYIAAQILGAVAGTALLAYVASGAQASISRRANSAPTASATIPLRIISSIRPWQSNW